MSKKVVSLKPPPPVDTPVRFLTSAGLVSGRAGVMPNELGLTAAAFENMDGTPPFYLVDVQVLVPGTPVLSMDFLLLRWPAVLGYTAGVVGPPPA